MFRTQGVNSGFMVAPPQPEVPEPRDLEWLFEALGARFRSSSLDSLHLIHIFVPQDGETREHMFSRFNQIAKPLEDETPRPMTKEQPKTTFMVQLR